MAREELDTELTLGLREEWPSLWKHGHSETLKALFLKMRRSWVYLSF